MSLRLLSSPDQVLPGTAWRRVGRPLLSLPEHPQRRENTRGCGYCPTLTPDVSLGMSCWGLAGVAVDASLGSESLLMGLQGKVF